MGLKDARSAANAPFLFGQMNQDAEAYHGVGERGAGRDFHAAHGWRAACGIFLGKDLVGLEVKFENAWSDRPRIGYIATACPVP